MDVLFMIYLIIGGICVIGAIWCAYGMDKILKWKDEDKEKKDDNRDLYWQRRIIVFPNDR